MNIYEELLKYCNEPIRSSQRVINAVSQGPIGRPDSQLLLGEEGEKAWHVTTTLKSANQKVVIFADPFFEFRKPSTYEPELWEELLNHHGVYCWQGSRIPLDELTPYYDVGSFWNEASKMPQERKEQIIESLRQQGHNPDHFLIIDAPDYYNFLADFILKITKMRGYSKGEYSALSLEDSIVTYIGKNLMMSSLSKEAHGVYDGLKQWIPIKVLELIQNTEIVHSNNSSLQKTINLRSNKYLDSVLREHCKKENESLLIYSTMGNVTEPIVLPRMIAMNLELLIDNGQWDLSAIEGCHTVSVVKTEEPLKKIKFIFPKQVLIIALKQILMTPELRKAMPDSVEELDLKIHSQQNLEELSKSIQTLPNLQKLTLQIDHPNENAKMDFSSFQLTELRIIASRSEIFLNGLPSTLEVLTCECISIEFPELENQTMLKMVRFRGDIKYIAHLPSSVEYLEIKNYNNKYFNDISLLKFIRLKNLTVLDCRTLQSLRDLPSSLESVFLVKCHSLSKLQLKGLKNLKMLELAHMGKEVKISCDRSLSSVRYFNAIGIAQGSRALLNLCIRARNDKKLYQDKSLEILQGERENTAISNVFLDTVRYNSEIVANLSNHRLENFYIEKSMLMDESYYPSHLKKLVVTDSVAWKYDLDLERFSQLEELKLVDIKDLVVIKNFPKSIKRITICDCNDLRGIDFQGIIQLESLVLRNIGPQYVILNNRDIQSIQNLEIDNASDEAFQICNLLSGLQYCSILIINNESRIGILRLPKACDSVTLNGCNKITNLSLKGIAGLKTIRVEYCRELSSIALPDSLLSLTVRYNYNFKKFHFPNALNIADLEEVFLFLNGSKNLESDQHTKEKLDTMTDNELNYFMIEKEFQIKKHYKEHREFIFGKDNLKGREFLVSNFTLSSSMILGSAFIPDIKHFSKTEILTLDDLCLKTCDGLPESLTDLRLQNCAVRSTGIDFSGMTKLTDFYSDNNKSSINITEFPISIRRIKINKPNGTISLRLRPSIKKCELELNQGLFCKLSSIKADTRLCIDSKSSAIKLSGLATEVDVISFRKDLGCNETYVIDFSGVKTVKNLYFYSSTVKQLVFLNASKDLVIENLNIYKNDVEHTPLTDEIRNLLLVAQIRMIALEGLSNASDLKFSPNIESLKISKCVDMGSIDFIGYKTLREIEITESDLKIINALPPYLKSLTLRENNFMSFPPLGRCKSLEKINMLNNYTNNRSHPNEKFSLATFLAMTENKNQTTELDIHSALLFGNWEFPNLMSWLNVSRLEISQMMLGDLNKLPHKVKKLKFSKCYSTTQCLDLSCLAELESLEIHEHMNLEVLKGFPRHLNILSIRECHELNFADFSNLHTIDHLSLKYTNSKKINSKFNEKLAVKKLWVNAYAFEDTDIARLIRLQNIEFLHLNILHEDFPFLKVGEIAHRVKSINIAYSNFSGILDLREFSQLEILKVIGSNNITAINNIPRSIRKIDLMGCDRIKVELNDYLDTITEVNISNCKQMVAEYAQSLSKLNHNSSLEDNFINLDKPTESGAITLNSLRTLRACSHRAESLEKERKRWEAFQRHINSALNEHEGYERGGPDAQEYNVMRIQSSDHYTPDSKTGFITHLYGSQSAASGIEKDNFMMVYDQRGLLINNYFRFCAYNTVESDVFQRSLYFCYKPKDLRKVSLLKYKNCHSLTENTLHELKSFVNKNLKWALGYAEFEIKPGQDVTLVTTPILYPTDQLVIYCDDAHNLDLVLDPTERKVSLSLQAGKPVQYIKVAYRFEIQEQYLLEQFNDELKLCLSPKPLLKSDLINEIKHVINRVDKLKFMHNPRMELREKLACLFEFCQNFDQEESPGDESKPTLDIIISQIRNARGVCRHRSEVFMVLAHYLNIPVSLYSNGKHMFPELVFFTQLGFVRYGVCLGGGLVLDLVRKSENRTSEPENPFIKLIAERELPHDNSVNINTKKEHDESSQIVTAENKNSENQPVNEQKEAERKAREPEEAKACEEELRKAKEEAEAKAREEELRKAKEEAETKAREEELRKAKEEAEAKAREEELRKAKEEAEAKAREEELRKAKEEAEAKAREEELRKAKKEAEAKAREEELRKAKEEEEARTREQAERKAQEDTQRATRETEAEAARIAEEKARELTDPFPSVKIITSVMPLMTNDGPHAPLLRLPNNLDPIKVFKGIRSELLNCSKLTWPGAILYVNNPTDLRRYMKSIKIEHGRRTAVPGPLKTLLDQGGIVVINWTEFSGRQKKDYMSMLEPGGTLMGIPVSPSVKIISLIQDKFRTGPRAFFTRSTAFLLSQSYEAPKEAVKSQASYDEFVEIDLYGMPNWRERLFGEIVVDESGYRLRENGALRVALNQKRNLRLINCPDTENFNKFLHRLRTEKCCYVNAEFIELPDGFIIQTLKKNQNLHHDNITIKSQPDEHSSIGVFCNANNLYECFRREVVDPVKRIRTETSPWFSTKESEFYLTERITREEWHELLDRYQEFAQHPITFTLLPGGEIEGVAIYSGEQNTNAETSFLVFTNDPDFYVNRLKETLLPEAIIVDVTPQMTYQELMAKLDDHRDEAGKVEFQYEPCVVMNNLLKGKSIILDGKMSLLLYQQLLPYLYPNLARFYQNGHEVQLKGQLICVMPLECRNLYPYHKIQIENISFENYKELLTEEDRVLSQKIIFFFEMARQLNHRGVGQPPIPELNYRWLTSMIARVKDKCLQMIHPENPIKGLFHYNYPKNSDNYAFLCVIAKYLFSPERNIKTVHYQKWERLIKARKIINKDDFTKHCWKVFNCCYGKTLRELLGDSLESIIEFKKGKPSLKDPLVLEKLCGLLRSEEARENRVEVSQHHKPTQQLHTLFFNPTCRAIFLKSTPGTGKSYQTRQLRSELPEGHYFKGLMQIEPYLSAQPIDRETPLLIAPDEINMEEPGSLNILKGLFREGPFHHKGRYFQIAGERKLVGSGNPETYTNRYFHTFIQNYAETVLFELPHEDWLRKNIIEPELLGLNFTAEENSRIADKLLWSFYHVKDYEPHCEISLRDLRSLAQRFVVAKKLSDNVDEAVKRAQWHEFGFMIRDEQQRKAYQKAIEYTPVIKSLSVISVGNLWIPSTKYVHIEILEEDLAICAMATEKNRAYRRGILMEGPSGIGKSSLYKAILQGQGYEKNHPDPLKRYYEISLDDGDEAARLIIRALCDGSKIILDEIDTRIESLLIALMEGELPEDPTLVALIHEVVGERFEVKVGGFVMASQNPGEVVSLALQNRFHYLQATDYTDEELLAVMKEAKIAKPEFVLEKFNEARRRDPVNYNPRKLFEWMRRQLNRTSQESLEVKEDPHKKRLK